MTFFRFSRPSRSLFSPVDVKVALLTGSLLTLAVAGCSGGKIDDTSSSAGGATSSASSSKAGSTTSAASTVASTSASSGQGGQGGMAGWPTCDTQPATAPLKTIPQVWIDDPSVPTEEWLPGVFVTGVSGAGCVANVSCQIFVQQAETYIDLADAGQKSIKIDILPSVAQHFTGIAVGDKVDVYAHALRDVQNGANELKLLVTPTIPGCAKVVGSGNPVPITTTLDPLTVTLYETQGPVLVKVNLVSGKPHLPSETFALWTTGGPIGTDITKVTSMSPYFLPANTFTGFTPETVTAFASVTGVFGLFKLTGPTKYEEIYIREMTEAPTL